MFKRHVCEILFGRTITHRIAFMWHVSTVNVQTTSTHKNNKKYMPINYIIVHKIETRAPRYLFSIVFDRLQFVWSFSISSFFCFISIYGCSCYGRHVHVMKIWFHTSSQNRRHYMGLGQEKKYQSGTRTFEIDVRNGIFFAGFIHIINHTSNDFCAPNALESITFALSYFYFHLQLHSYNAFYFISFVVDLHICSRTFWNCLKSFKEEYVQCTRMK